MTRAIESYVRRDDISWWAGVQYVGGDYITETATMTRRGAIVKSRQMARKARRLRDKQDFNKKIKTGAAQ